MGSQPWFKFYAGDYLVDADVDAIPREAEGLLIRMWAVCHLEGSCPDDPEELARKTRCKLQYVLQYKPHCQSLFESQNGRLYSRRMEAEKRRSEQASKNASQRYKQKGSAVSNANGNANRTAASDSDFDSKKGLVSVSSNASKELTYESDIEDGFDVLVEQIGHEHPANARFNGRDLNEDIRYVIAEAIHHDGKDVVVNGTRAYARAVANWPASQRRYITSALKFYQQRDYLQSQEHWEQWVEKKPTESPSTNILHDNPATRAAALLEEA